MFVKDLSRFGRNYIEVGKLSEEFFPEYGIRLVAVSDNIDSFEGENEPIIDRDTFEKVQTLFVSSRHKPINAGESNMFSGILKCADCGGNLHYHFNSGNKSIKYFNCSNYNKGSKKTCFSTHYIRLDYLEKVVLAELRRVIRYATQNEEAFTKAILDYSKVVYKQKRRNTNAGLNRFFLWQP